MEDTRFPQSQAERDACAQTVGAEGLCDAASSDAELLVTSREKRGIELRGPAPPNASWHTRLTGAYTLDQFRVDRDQQHIHCPPGKVSRRWKKKTEVSGGETVAVRFAMADCGGGEPCRVHPLNKAAAGVAASSAGPV